MLNILLISTVLLLASCNGDKQSQGTVAAIETGEKARTTWQKSLKAVEISLESADGYIPAWPRLGVCIEKEATIGKPFVKQRNVYVPEGHVITTSDTTSSIHICFPYREGLAVDDTIHLYAPFGENLYGQETSRKVSATLSITAKLCSAMALLQIAVESDDLRDRLDELSIAGEHLYAQGSYQPYTGKWIDAMADGILRATDTGCLLNNGRKHDFFLIPTDTGGHISLSARINGKSHVVRTVLPPMPPGSLIRLSLRKGKDGLSILGSWVETERPLTDKPETTAVDSICVGHYLQTDGTIKVEKDSLSVAVVVETDGKHGKAVALSDCEGNYVFSGQGITNGKIFSTIDGKRTEGILNPTGMTEETDKIIYKPGMPYPEDCALGYTDGASLTQRLLEVQGQGLSGKEPLPDLRPMLEEVKRYAGSYVPSLGEMVRLYYLLKYENGFRKQSGIMPLEGEYLTCSEITEQALYTIDFTRGIITGQLSKRYAPRKLRLFYLF